MNGKEKVEIARFNNRTFELLELGFVNSGTCWIHDDRVITTAEIQHNSVDEWMQKMDAIRAFNKKHKKGRSSNGRATGCV